MYLSDNATPEQPGDVQVAPAAPLPAQGLADALRQRPWLLGHRPAVGDLQNQEAHRQHQAPSFSFELQGSSLERPSVNDCWSTVGHTHSGTQKVRLLGQTG